MSNFFKEYADRLQNIMENYSWDNVEKLAERMDEAWKNNQQIFLCGNGGSAGNAIHLANDFIYGVAKGKGPGMRIHALPANQAVMTCLANDESYAEVFSQQLAALGNSGDILIVLSGSGNSPNVVRALEKAKEMGMYTSAILGYSGGKCLELADLPIHFAIDDMQISEDLQQIVGHMIMRKICK